MTETEWRRPDFAWLDGRIVPFDQCVVHARSQGAFWGANVFEGVRAYWDDDSRRLSLFRVDDHIERLRRSMKCLHMPATHSDDEIRHAIVELLLANESEEDVHVCVVAYFGLAPNCDSLGVTDEAGMHITATPAPRSPGYRQGLSASISSWRRISDDTMPPRIKTGANYHNSRLAHQEAVRNGYDTTLLLNQRGTVSEAPGACVVMVRDGKLVTPPGTSGVLEGITVATVDELAGDRLGMTIERREIDRTELYVAEEIFVCGTRAEIQPVVSIDRLPVGRGVPGPITGALQEAYQHAALGRAPYRRWSTPVSASSSASSRPQLAPR